jgi:acyl-CoA hydrolase
MRRHSNLSYVPSRLSLVPVLLQRRIPADVVIIHCAPPRDGQLSLGIEVNILPAAIEGCRMRSGRVVAVINDQMPYTYGDALVPVEWVDVAIEVSEPLPAHDPATPDDDSRAIGERVASRVSDGSTLQMGIGGVPDATLNALTGRTGLRIWTEMFSDGVLALDRVGALDPHHPLTASFLFGSARALRLARRQPPGADDAHRAHQRPGPDRPAAQDDLGQHRAGGRPLRPGQRLADQRAHLLRLRRPDRLHRRCAALPGGQSFIALRSWHPKADVSTVVPLVDEPVTSFQQSAIVTEHGVAELWGYDQQAQCRHIIRDAAHPQVRDELWEEAPTSASREAPSLRPRESSP